MKNGTRSHGSMRSMAGCVGGLGKGGSMRSGKGRGGGGGAEKPPAWAVDHNEWGP